jgi:hypothetical protein
VASSSSSAQSISALCSLLSWIQTSQDEMCMCSGCMCGCAATQRLRPAPVALTTVATAPGGGAL